MTSKRKTNPESFWARAMRNLKRNRLAVWAGRFIAVLAVVALLADFLAQEKPIVAKYQDSVYWPVFRGYAVDLELGGWPEPLRNVEWAELEYDWAVWPLVPYLPRNTDLKNAHYTGPFDDQNVRSMHWRHWLGTDKLGRDVLAALIHGTRTALLVGLIAMGIAAIIGIVLGALAGFYGDSRLRISRAQLICLPIALFFGLFWALGSRGYAMSHALETSIWAFVGQLLLSMALFGGTLVLGWLLARLLNRLPGLQKDVAVPVDILISRLIEIMVSIPTLFLIMALVAVAQSSLWVVMVVIGFTTWPNTARFIRAELLRIRSLEYVEAAQALGYSNRRILLNHAIPNALSPVLVTIAFGIAGAIIVEATLSFIGVGVPADTFTWGKLLAGARANTEAWWLAVLPGIAIFVTVTMFNLLGDGLSDAIDPKRNAAQGSGRDA